MMESVSLFVRKSAILSIGFLASIFGLAVFLFTENIQLAILAAVLSAACIAIVILSKRHSTLEVQVAALQKQLDHAQYEVSALQAGIVARMDMIVARVDVLDQKDESIAQSIQNLQDGDIGKIALLDIRTIETARLVDLTRAGVAQLARGERLPQGFHGVDVFDPELDMLALVASLVEPKTAIDVGANRGSMTAALRKVGFSVDAFEPHPMLAQALQQRFNDDHHVRIHALACSDTVGTAALYTVKSSSEDRDDSLFSTLEQHPVFAGFEFFGSINVPKTTLNTMIANGGKCRVGLLKTDTEGHDLAVLRGASQIDAGALLVEFWDKDHVFNAGDIQNTLDDYLAAVDRSKYPYYIVFWRQSAFDHFGIMIGGTETPVGSWGNILFSPDKKLVDALSRWAEVTYGTEHVNVISQV